MSNYKLAFTLKQHTPIIHFQADQKGATLRATELKPKLDRFLIDKLKMLDDNKKPLDKYKSWFIGEGKQHLALDYKVRVEYSGDLKYYIPNAMSLNSRWYPNREQSVINYLQPSINIKGFISPTLFFANADKIKFQYRSDEVDGEKSKIDQLAYAIQSEGDIQCSIISYNTELLENIKMHIHHFFAKENFGTRQNKGFGCFEVISPESSKTHEQLLKDNYSIIYKCTALYNSNDFSEIFKRIKNDYTHLKSGLNHNGYKKSKLFQYFAKDEKNPIRWEKRIVKQTIHKHQIRNKTLKIRPNTNNSALYGLEEGEQSWTDKEIYNYAYIRALLGLTDKYEFIINENNTEKYIVKVSNPNVKRFKSPITFKINNREIYLVTNNFDNTIFANQFFDFQFLFRNNQLFYYENHIRKDVTLEFPLPVPTNFNIDSFLHYALSGQESIADWKCIKRSQNATN